MEEEGGEIGVGETVDKHGLGIDKCTKVEGRGVGGALGKDRQVGGDNHVAYTGVDEGRLTREDEGREGGGEGNGGEGDGEGGVCKE